MGSPSPRKATESEALLNLEQTVGQIAAGLSSAKAMLELGRASRVFPEETFRPLYEEVCALYDKTALLVTTIADKESELSSPVRAPAIIHSNHKR